MMPSDEIPGAMWSSPPTGDDTSAITAHVEQVHAECVALCNEINANLMTIIEGCHAVCTTTDAECNACIEGYISSIHGRAEAVNQICLQKIRDHIANKLGEAAYTASQTIGYQPVSLDQMVGDLACDEWPTCGPLGCGGGDGGGPGGDGGDGGPGGGGIDVEPIQPPDGGGGGGPGSPGYCPTPPPACPPSTINVNPPACPTPNITVNVHGPFSPDVDEGGGGGDEGGGDESHPCPPGEEYDETVGDCIPIKPPDEGGGGDEQPPNMAWQFNSLELQAGLFTNWNVAHCPEIPDPFEVGEYNGELIFEHWTGFGPAAGPGDMPVTFQKLLSQLPMPESVGKWLWGAAHFVAVNGPAWVTALAESMGGCNLAGVSPRVAGLALVGIVERWAGCDLSFLGDKLKMDIQLACPTDLPGQSQVNDLYIRGYISEDTWTCWTRANDNLDVPHSIVREASRPIPDYREAFAAEVLGREGNGFYNRIVALNGWDVKQWDAYLKHTLHWYPSISNAMQYMTSGAYNEADAAAWGLDAGFNNAFNANAEKWLLARGVEKGNAQLLWRLSRNLPGVSQILAMHQRFRKDSFDKQDAALAFDDAEFERLLTASGVPQGFRDRLINLAFKKLTKQEAARLYANKLITRKEIISIYQDYGYHHENAEVMVALQDELNAKKETPKPVLLTKRLVLTQYTDGIISESEARQALNAVGTTPEDADAAMKEGTFVRLWKLRKKAVTAIRHRYSLGELTINGVVVALMAAGIAQEESNLLAASWEKVQNAKGKFASLGQLCKWWTQGLIEDEEYLRRLVNLGWTRSDAMRIIDSCYLDWEKKNTPKPPKGTVKPKPDKPKKPADLGGSNGSTNGPTR